MSDGEIIINLEKVNFSYAPGGEVLKDVNLIVRRGQSGCIVGPNGGGKSTLLKLILGLIHPESGKIEVFGTSPEEARLKIGYMPQYHAVDSAFPITVAEVVQLGAMGLKLSQGEIRRRAAAALAELGIEHLAKSHFSRLSGGQRQRVLIARALCGEPELLLLDEPTANIDPGAEEQFYETLNTLRQKLTVLTVSHDLGFVYRETDLVICVNKFVTIHKAADFTAENANEVYHHQVNFIQHNHDCFCNCHSATPPLHAEDIHHDH